MRKNKDFFKIQLDYCLLFAIKTSLKKLSALRFYTLNLDIEIRDDLLTFDLLAKQCTHSEIYSLGGTIFDSIYKWNNYINNIYNFKPYQNMYTGDLVFLNEFEKELVTEAKKMDCI
ncbi:MAG: hypothetical protein WCK82_08115 [Bacteroidota bacterium]